MSSPPADRRQRLQQLLLLPAIASPAASAPAAAASPPTPALLCRRGAANRGRDGMAPTSTFTVGAACSPLLFFSGGDQPTRV